MQLIYGLPLHVIKSSGNALAAREHVFRLADPIKYGRKTDFEILYKMTYLMAHLADYTTMLFSITGGIINLSIVTLYCLLEIILLHHSAHEQNPICSPSVQMKFKTHPLDNSFTSSFWLVLSAHVLVILEDHRTSD